MQFFGVHRCNGTGKIHLFLHAITHHHSLLQHHVILLKDNRYRTLCSRNVQGLGRVAQAGYFQRSLPCSYTDREVTIDVGDRGIVGTGDHDDGSDNGLPGRIQDSTVNGPVLGVELQKRSQRQNQGNSNSFDLSHR